MLALSTRPSRACRRSTSPTRSSRPGPNASATCCRHSSAKGAAASRGTAISIDGSVANPICLHFAVAVGKVDRAVVHGCRQRLVHHMHDELPVAVDVARGVLSTEIGLVLPAEHHERGIFGEDVEELKGAALTAPFSSSVVTRAIGRGTTTPHSNLYR